MGIYKSYDIRGEYGTELTEEIVYKIGRAYVTHFKPATVVVAMDGRISSPKLHAELVRGLTDQGCDVIDIGHSSTDMFYYAVHHLKADGGLTVTASHMPKQFNGVKVVGPGAMAISYETGVGALGELVEKGEFVNVSERGKVESTSVLDEFVAMCKTFVETDSIKGLKVVMDPGNGMGGLVASALYDTLGIEIIKMNYEQDGTFPNRSPNPLETHDLVCKKVIEEGADLGVMWDADCDRAFFVDNKGNFILGDYIIGLLAKQILAKRPGSGIIYDLRSSDYAHKTIEQSGGKPYECRVGHSHFKQMMRDTGSVFAGEVSGHYYYVIEETLYADNGFIPPLQIMELLCKDGKSFYELLADAREFHKSEEINSEVEDKESVVKKIEKHYTPSATDISHLDGLKMRFDTWWFNIRASNTENKLRLNLEASSAEELAEKTKEVLRMIRS